MKTAGEILSSLFDEQFVEKAHGYTNLFNSWADITAKNGIAAAAAHSRIKELEKGIVLIEMDHPGWKQILQTKQSKLLNDFRYRFPKLDIKGISLMLGKPDCAKTASNQQPAELVMSTKQDENPQSGIDSKQTIQDAKTQIQTTKTEIDKSVAANIESIKNEDLKEKLIKLGQTISKREQTKNIN